MKTCSTPPLRPSRTRSIPSTNLLGAVALATILGVSATSCSSSSAAEAPREPPATTGGIEVLADIGALRARVVADAAPATLVLGYASADDDGGGGLFRWDPASGVGPDGGLTFTSTDPSAPTEGRWLRVFSGPVHAAWWGLAGDGTDETPDLQAAFDAASGRGIVFSAPRVYGFSGILTIPSEVTVQNNGATLLLLADPGGANMAVQLGDRVRADLIKIDVAPGVTVRRLLLVGGANDIERIELSSADRQANRDSNLDGALQIRATDVRIGGVTISGFDKAAFAYQAERVVIERLDITDYVLGFHIRECRFVELLSGQMTTPSPIATTDPGHNGLLFETGDDIVVSDMIIHDAGEHAFRIGGSGNSSRFVFNNIQAIRPGQCGLKINPVEGFRVRDVQINGLTVVDAAATSIPGTNEDGLRLEKCSHVTVNGFQVEKRDRGVSAYVGIFIAGCDNVTINGPKISDVAAHGIHLQDRWGPVNQIYINNPTILGPGQDGILVESPTQILRDITVMRCYVRNQAGWGIRVLANSPTVGVNQPMILDGWVKDDGLGAVSLSTSDADIHDHVTVLN